MVASNKAVNESNSNVEVVYKEYKKKQSKVKKETYRYVSVNGNKEARILGTNIVATETLANQTRKLFGIIYYYNGSESYLARKSKAKPLADDSILVNSKLFGEGEDSAKSLDMLGIHSKLVNIKSYLTNVDGPNINGVVEVEYQLTTQGSKKIGRKAYTVTYNRESAKFTAVNPINE
ncbi:hypothetical protein FC36_GL000861 [Ligilactobacillus equi DSM 15833 = JCM 10991]|uniref:Uncharacterized protein n=2 Tax=Ligilactobacillus equi TaxID=137357 RepID=A0A0R1TL20_9LACO|nr:hypothetical protein FC36_GL000861 [Ligilactobacillus equi DSM 15833 = JCM 10991]